MNETKASVPGSEAVFQSWLRRQYSSCVSALIDMFRKGQDERHQVASLATLMEFTRGDRSLGFDSELFARIFEATVTEEGVAAEVLGALSEKYAVYDDIRYYMLKNIKRICDRNTISPALLWVRNGQAGTTRNVEGLSIEGLGSESKTSLGDGHFSKPESDAEKEKLYPDVALGGDSLHDVSRNILDLLLCLPTPTSQKAQSERASSVVHSWCGLAEEGRALPANDAMGSKQRKKHQRNHQNGNDRGKRGQLYVKWANVKLCQRAYSEAWMSFLRVDLPDDVYKKILTRIHDLVIPNLTSPLLLADFLTHSLDRGGLEGMLALHGIFLLVTKFGMEYPKFYQRLYNLIDADVFFTRHRMRFFQLADIFLASSLVPAYTAAAFAKKFARLGLVVPPSGALIAIAFIHNILRRHPACLQLLHRPPPGGIAGSSHVARGEGSVWQGQDVYDFDEKDPAQSRALESSLWEVKALKTHSCPSVSMYCAILEKDLSNRRRTAEIDVEEVLHVSYGSLFMKEVKRRLKTAPVAFYREFPDKLFHNDSLDDFPGWK